MKDKEIGGYLELDEYCLPMLHQEALALNCGKNCLLYLIESKKIKRIHLPYFICSSIINACKRVNVNVVFYHVGMDFYPKSIDYRENDWVYIVNYYGQLANRDLQQLKKKYKKIIVDNAQAYFDMPINNIDTLYSCRKFFGVPDGAFLYTDSKLNRHLERDISFERMHFLLGRYEKCASDFFEEYKANNARFSNEPIKEMSKLTDNLLHGIDYNHVKNKRTHNYRYYFNELVQFNELVLEEIEGAFAYPLYIENGESIRQKLIKKRIYIPTLWPNVLEELSPTTVEHKLAKNILPLPTDQRYTEEDLETVIQTIKRGV